MPTDVSVTVSTLMRMAPTKPVPEVGDSSMAVNEHSVAPLLNVRVFSYGPMIGLASRTSSSARLSAASSVL